ncbi:hypothetical protein J6590_041834, partial [Homalodisca vitripennis]
QTVLQAYKRVDNCQNNSVCTGLHKYNGPVYSLPVYSYRSKHSASKTTTVAQSDVITMQATQYYVPAEINSVKTFRV